jgi:predicted DNA-binding protein (UPF0251 family)
VAVDRNAIVTLHEKDESNSVIAKKLQIRRDTVWKLVKNSRKLVKHAIDLVKEGNEVSEQNNWPKT